VPRLVFRLDPPRLVPLVPLGPYPLPLDPLGPYPLPLDPLGLVRLGLASGRPIQYRP
jgi:hypothetical protein